MAGNLSMNHHLIIFTDHCISQVYKFIHPLIFWYTYHIPHKSHLLKPFNFLYRSLQCKFSCHHLVFKSLNTLNITHLELTLVFYYIMMASMIFHQVINWCNLGTIDKYRLLKAFLCPHIYLRNIFSHSLMFFHNHYSFYMFQR